MVALPEAWTALKHHDKQQQLWNTEARFVAVAAGRGSGKTEIAKRRVVRWLPIKKPWKDPKYFFALPTLPQAKRVAWQSLIDLIPSEWLAKDPNRTDLIIETVFGSSLHVIGLDRPHRAEGVQWDGGVIDESSDQKPGVFERTFRPAMTHRKAWCWRIGVPKRNGIGAADFKNFCVNNSDEYYNWPSADIIDSGEVESAMDTMDSVDFLEQYCASWQDTGGGIFHAFDESANVSPSVEYDAARPILVGSDFNVNPMSWVLCHDTGTGLEVFDELFIRNTNTPRTLDRLHAKYQDHQAGWQFYGDATGRARKTSASVSDYQHILADDRFDPKRVRYLKSNPARMDRFSACNALLKSASGMINVRINPRCTRLIADLDQRAYKEGTSEPDDFGDIGHITDAFGYVVYFRYPQRVQRTENKIFTGAN